MLLCPGKVSKLDNITILSIGLFQTTLGWPMKETDQHSLTSHLVSWLVEYFLCSGFFLVGINMKPRDLHHLYLLMWVHPHISFSNSHVSNILVLFLPNLC